MRKNILQVPQEYILGPLQFNTFMRVLFTILEDIGPASYAYDTTPFVSYDTPENLINSLEACSATLFKSFFNNQTKTSLYKMEAKICTRCLSFVTFNLLLVTFHLLLVTFCSLLVNFPLF